MKAPFSPYLERLAPGMKKLIGILGEEYEYVSVLSTDSKGFAVSISKRAKSVGHSTMMTERGNVVRVYKDGLYSEFAFDRFDPEAPEKTAEEAVAALERQFALIKLTGTSVYETPPLDDEPASVFEEMETEILPEETDISALIEELGRLSDMGIAAGEHIIDCRIRAESTHVCKMFLTARRDMRQSYVYSEAIVLPIAVKDGANKISHQGVSDRLGPEIFRNMDDLVVEAAQTAEQLLSADRMVPGEYEIITSPEVTGLIAHEAFGHGVEMDMFVKNRALGARYIDQRVGSDLVTMHEGAAADIQVASCAFDDEGTLAGDTIEIENGFLRTGVCDALSALRLGTKPTGNGKRENFEHKVYARMTNTFFASGKDYIGGMIESVKHGYLLKGIHTPLHAPKHCGIHCIVERGYEIKDGRLTGKVVSPIIMTGYVPDLLGSVSMVSTDRELFGGGGCGKGYKEMVKVSDGGPYMKAKARLG